MNFFVSSISVKTITVQVIIADVQTAQMPQRPSSGRDPCPRAASALCRPRATGAPSPAWRTGLCVPPACHSRCRASVMIVRGMLLKSRDVGKIIKPTACSLWMCECVSFPASFPVIDSRRPVRVPSRRGSPSSPGLLGFRTGA